MTLAEYTRDDRGQKVRVFRDRPEMLDPMVEAERPTFRTLNLLDIEQLPEPEWLIAGILPATSMTTLYGAPGSAKSFWALDAALSVASGTPFHGADVKAGKVIYSLGEGLRGLQYRIEAWLLAHPYVNRELLVENFHVIPKAVHLLDQYESSSLINTIEDHGDVSLLIIDTLARALVGGDENSAGDIGRAVSICDKVRDLSGSATLIVHHMDAAGTKARGSTALPGASDAMLKMVKDDIQHSISVTCTKMKDGEPFKPMHYTLESYGHSAALLGKTVDSTSKFRSRTQYNNEENPF
jgi:hypothetical protein